MWLSVTEELNLILVILSLNINSDMWPQHEMAQFWSLRLLAYSLATSLLPCSLNPNFVHVVRSRVLQGRVRSFQVLWGEGTLD